MKVDNRKICLIIPSLQTGGMERVMSELAGYFCQKTNLEVHMVLYGRRPKVFYYVPDNLIIHRPKTKFNNILRFFHTIDRLLFLRNKVRKIDPDFILSFGELWNSFVLLALMGLNYKVFISDRCSPNKDIGFFHEQLRAWLYPYASGIVVQTFKAQEVYQHLFNFTSIKVIGNPIRVISNNPEVLKENIVLSVGRLINSKHHDNLIKLFVQINMPNWKLVIVGDDALKQKNMARLKSLVKELKCEDRIILTGARNDVDVFYNKSSIFVLTSSSEGFPNVIGEAMSAGLPVVSFDCLAGPSDLITNGKDGFLVPVFNYELLKDKLIELMNDPILRNRLGSEAVKSVNRFSSDKICHEYYSFITLNK